MRKQTSILFLIPLRWTRNRKTTLLMNRSQTQQEKILLVIRSQGRREMDLLMIRSQGRPETTNRQLCHIRWPRVETRCWTLRFRRKPNPPIDEIGSSGQVRGEEVVWQRKPVLSCFVPMDIR